MTRSILSNLDYDSVAPDRLERLVEHPLPYLERMQFDGVVEIPLELACLDESTRLEQEHERVLFQQMHLAFHEAAGVRQRVMSGEGSVERVEEFERLVRRGELIRNRLSTVFHKLAVAIAGSFVGPRLTWDELTSEAHSTLLYAMSKFDPDRGFRFSTYATHAIRRRLARYATQQTKRGEVLTDWDDARLIDSRRWTVAYERNVDRSIQHVETLLRELPPRERYVIRSRFGWGREFDPRTLQEIADEFGVSRERVRQLEARALAKLQKWAQQRGMDE